MQYALHATAGISSLGWPILALHSAARGKQCFSPGVPQSAGRTGEASRLTVTATELERNLIYIYIYIDVS